MPEHIAKRKIVTESSEHNNVIAVPTEAKLLTKVKLMIILQLPQLQLFLK